jgi:hypothetical protein
MQLDNQSPWSAAVIPGWGLNRNLQMTCIIKLGFQWDSQGKLTPLAAEQCDICYSDEYANDDPDTGSILQANDTVPFKQGFEWLLSGTLKPKAGSVRQELSVRFLHEQWQSEKKLIATGQRFWKKSILGLIPSEPKQLTELSINYEHAYGGCYTDENEKVTQYNANPIGTGYYKARDKKNKQPVLLPIFEVEPLIYSSKTLATPAGFNALSLTWSPRVEAFKQLDGEAAAEGLCPYPRQVDKTLYNCAPLDQQFAAAPPAGTQLQLRGFFEQPVNIILPEVAEHIRLLHVIEDKVEKLNPTCDTLLINTDTQSIVFVYRQAIAWHPMNSPISQLLLTEADTDQKQAESPNIDRVDA